MTGQSRRQAEAGEPCLAGVGIYHEIGGLDVLVDEAARMQGAERLRDADSEPEEMGEDHGRANHHRIEKVAPRIAKQKGLGAAIAREVQRLHGPCRLQFIAQRVPEVDPVDARLGRMFGGGRQQQNGFGESGRLPPEEDELAVIPELHKRITGEVNPRMPGWMMICHGSPDGV
jgi:hypothetical protein